MISIVHPSADNIFEVEGITLRVMGVEEDDTYRQETKRLFVVGYGRQNLKLQVFKREADIFWADGKRTKVHIGYDKSSPVLMNILQKWRNNFLWHLEDEFERFIKRTYPDMTMKRTGDTISDVSEPLYGKYEVWPRGTTRKGGKKNHLHFKLVVGFDFWEPKTISRFEIGGVLKVLDQKISKVFFDDIEATAIQTSLAMQEVLSK